MSTNNSAAVLALHKILRLLSDARQFKSPVSIGSMLAAGAETNIALGSLLAFDVRACSIPGFMDRPALTIDTTSRGVPNGDRVVRRTYWMLDEPLKVSASNPGGIVLTGRCTGSLVGIPISGVPVAPATIEPIQAPPSPMTIAELQNTVIHYLASSAPAPVLDLRNILDETGYSDGDYCRDSAILLDTLEHAHRAGYRVVVKPTNKVQFYDPPSDRIGSDDRTDQLLVNYTVVNGYFETPLKGCTALELISDLWIITGGTGSGRVTNYHFNWAKQVTITENHNARTVTIKGDLLSAFRLVPGQVAWVSCIASSGL